MRVIETVPVILTQSEGVNFCPAAIEDRDILIVASRHCVANKKRVLSSACSLFIEIMSQMNARGFGR